MSAARVAAAGRGARAEIDRDGRSAWREIDRIQVRSAVDRVIAVVAAKNEIFVTAAADQSVIAAISPDVIPGAWRLHLNQIRQVVAKDVEASRRHFGCRLLDGEVLDAGRKAEAAARADMDDGVIAAGVDDGVAERVYVRVVAEASVQRVGAITAVE